MEKEFGIVSWCDEDISCALENCDMPITEHNKKMLKDWMQSHWFTDMMIERGWEIINNKLSEDGFERYEEE